MDARQLLNRALGLPDAGPDSPEHERTLLFARYLDQLDARLRAEKPIRVLLEATAEEHATVAEHGAAIAQRLRAFADELDPREIEESV